MSNPAIQTGEMKNCFHRGKDKGSFGLGVLSHLSQEYNRPDLKSNKVGVLEAGGLIVEYLTSLLCSCFFFALCCSLFCFFCELLSPKLLKYVLEKMIV